MVKFQIDWSILGKEKIYYAEILLLVPNVGYYLNINQDENM